MVILLLIIMNLSSLVLKGDEDSVIAIYKLTKHMPRIQWPTER